MDLNCSFLFLVCILLLSSCRVSSETELAHRAKAEHQSSDYQEAIKLDDVNSIPTSSKLKLSKTFTSEHAFLEASNINQKIRVNFENQDLEYFDISTQKTQKTRPLNGLPEKVNVAFLLPDKDHILTFREAEGSTKYLYWYSISDDVFKRIEAGIYPRVIESVSKNFTCVFNSFGNQLFIINEKGEVVSEFDYQTLTNFKEAPLTGALVSDDGKYLLIHASSKTFFFSLEEEQPKLLWTRSSLVSFLHMGNILPEKNSLILIGRQFNSDKNRANAIFELSLHDGQVISYLDDVDRTCFKDNKIFTSKNKKYYEYSID